MLEGEVKHMRTPVSLHSVVLMAGAVCVMPFALGALDGLVQELSYYQRVGGVVSEVVGRELQIARRSASLNSCQEQRPNPAGFGVLKAGVRPIHPFYPSRFG